MNRTLIAIWICAFLWLGMVTTITVHAHYFPLAHTVYDIYAGAAHHWWQGQDLYARDVDSYRYSPLFAIVFSPFAALPDCWGVPLWKSFNCILYAAALGTWARRVLPRRLTSTEMSWFYVLTLPVSMHSMYNGQANVPMLACLLFGLSAVVDKRWNVAAGCLAAATLIKGYPVGLALLIAGIYPIPFVIRYIVAMGIGLAIPFMTQPWSLVTTQYHSWLHHLGASTHVMRERLRSFDHFLLVHHYVIDPRYFLLVELVTAGLVLALCLWTARRYADPRIQARGMFLFFSTWVVLFGPATETCTYVVIAPAISYAIVEACDRSRKWLTPVTLLASMVMMGPLVTDAFGRTIRDFAVAHGSQPTGALIFGAYLLIDVAQTALGHTHPPSTRPLVLRPEG